MPRRPWIPRGRHPCLPIRRSRPCLPSPRPLFRRRLARQRMCLRHRRFLPFPPCPRRRRLRPFPCPPFRRCRRPRRRRSRPRQCRRRHPNPSDPIPTCCTQREPERPTECGATDRELFARTHVTRPGWDPAWVASPAMHGGSPVCCVTNPKEGDGGSLRGGCASLLVFHKRNCVLYSVGYLADAMRGNNVARTLSITSPSLVIEKISTEA